MSTTRQSDCFKPNFFLWTIFGIWPGQSNKKNYKYFAFCYLFLTLLIYNILLTLNLIYTPRKIELLIGEVIFYFTEIGVSTKVLMILLMRNKIQDVLDLLDCELFKGDDDITRDIVNKSVQKYKLFWKLYAIFANFCYSSLIFLPVFIHLLFGKSLGLPICKYYFLTDDVRDTYFIYLYIYQSLGMYGHMVYNIGADLFVGGLMFLAITQLKLIHYKMINLNVESCNISQDKVIKERKLTRKLHQCLRHYDIILRYCSEVQDIISIFMFVLFASASLIICIVICAVVLVPSDSGSYLFMMNYLFAVMFEIFLPGLLGTQLSHESQELALAAYSSDWIPRSEMFKRCIRIFITRANTPIVLSGYKMFPLTLGTFSSILKSAYSFYTLVRNVQDKTQT